RVHNFPFHLTIGVFTEEGIMFRECYKFMSLLSHFGDGTYMQGVEPSCFYRKMTSRNRRRVDLAGLESTEV
ncbi:hypothetical protein, partial [Oleiphilus sp. HI0061]